MSGQDTFISHLVELRDRLLRALLAVLIVFVALFIWPGSGPIYDVLAAPLMHALPQGTTMIATGVVTPFLVPVKVTALVGFMIALPYVLYQAWAFVAPGLYEHEKKLALPTVVGSTLLFLLGVGFCYFFVFGKVFAFIHEFAPKSITVAPDIEAYFGFVITMFLAFGIAFQIPIVVVVLARLGLVNRKAARGAALRHRRHLRRRRGRHPARRAVAVHARGADVPALRDRAVFRAPRRAQEGGSGSRGGGREPADVRRGDGARARSGRSVSCQEPFGLITRPPSRSESARPAQTARAR